MCSSSKVLICFEHLGIQNFDRADPLFLQQRNLSSVRGDNSIYKWPKGTDVASRYQSTSSDPRPIFKETFDFAVTQVDNFCKNELITVMFKIFDGKDASFVLFKPEL